MSIKSLLQMLDELEKLPRAVVTDGTGRRKGRKK